MSNIIVFTKEEETFIKDIMNIINQKNPEEASYIQSRMETLKKLAETASEFPSFRDTKTIGNSTFSMESLIEMICDMDFADQIMYVPTKVIVGRSYVVSKVNFILMLKYEAESIEELSGHVKTIDKIAGMNIYGLMSEEVYLSLIQEKDLDIELKKRAAVRLMNIWEYRLTQSAEDYAPMLSSLWKSRKKLSPIYGTMMGMSEMLQITQTIDPVWFDFIGSSEYSDSVLQSLEEFLFNLTYEELCHIREIMLEKKITSIDKKNIESLLHLENIYSDFNNADPREMLMFYKQRKKNAELRKKARKPGPTKTIEEYILLFLLKIEKAYHPQHTFKE
ncbi:MAG: hypothetical protein PQJ46_06055 [Spirochaetales bacterium]|nr:hypothetical protein [Spirochaetales bacterium]